MQRGGTVAPTSDEVQQQRTYRLVPDDEVIEALRSHPGTSRTQLARILHEPHNAIDWRALTAQLERLAGRGRVCRVINGNRRKWTGWQVSE
jgi:hypothetical protein